MPKPTPTDPLASAKRTPSGPALPTPPLPEYPDEPPKPPAPTIYDRYRPVGLTRRVDVSIRGVVTGIFPTSIISEAMHDAGVLELLKRQGITLERVE